MPDTAHPMDSTVESRSTCNPLDYLSLSTPRQGALASAGSSVANPFPTEEAGALSHERREGLHRIRAGRAVVTPPRILR